MELSSDVVFVILFFFFNRELDDELQDSLYEFLEARGINGELAVFLHKYIKNKDKTEFLGWMRSVKSSIETQVK
jgi:complement component 1 Q subcomponent-binding protein